MTKVPKTYAKMPKVKVGVQNLTRPTTFKPYKTTGEDQHNIQFTNNKTHRQDTNDTNQPILNKNDNASKNKNHQNNQQKINEGGSDSDSDIPGKMPKQPKKTAYIIQNPHNHDDTLIVAEQYRFNINTYRLKTLNNIIKPKVS